MSIKGSSINLGSIFDAFATQAPQANPNFGAAVDENGNLIDKGGVPLPSNQQPGGDSYVDPSQRYVPLSGYSTLFNPDLAKFVNETNANTSQYGTIQQMQHDAQQDIAATDYDKVKGALSTPASQLSGDQGAILTGNNPTSGNINNANADAYRNAYGLPNSTAQLAAVNTGNNIRQNATYSNTHGPEDAGMTQAYADYNSLTGERQKTAVGYPINAVNAANAGNIYQQANSQYNLPNIKPEAELKSKQLGGALASVDDENSARANQAYLSSVLAGARASMAPTEAASIQNESRNNAFNTSHPPLPTSPYYRGKDNRPVLDTSFLPSLAQMQAKMGTGTNAPVASIPLSSGYSILPPATKAEDAPSSYNTPATREVKGEMPVSAGTNNTGNVRAPMITGDNGDASGLSILGEIIKKMSQGKPLHQAISEAGKK